MLNTPCVQCGHTITAPDSLRGKDVPCQNCGAMNIMGASPSQVSRSTPANPTNPGLGRAVNEQSASVKGLQDLSDLLLLFAYVIGVLLLVAGFTPYFLSQGGDSYQILCAIAGSLSAILMFVTFKFLSGLLQAVSQQIAGQIVVQEQLKDILTLLREEREL